MRELNASRFFNLVGSVREIRTFIDTKFDDAGRQEPLIPEARANMRNHFDELQAATQFVGAELSNRSANRMLSRLSDNDQQVSVQEVRDAILDVENRLHDELFLMSFIVLDRWQKSLFAPANDLAQWDFVRIFPDAARELEEAAKCLALKRPTAGVFHAMRMLEVGIRKVAELLEIPPVEKPAQRNWATILKAISDKIAAKFTAKDRMNPSSPAAAFDRIYASLDAVKNPWRNNTMHVEGFYSDAEAMHILRCVTVFMQHLAALCEPDEPMPSDENALGGAVA